MPSVPKGRATVEVPLANRSSKGAKQGSCPAPPHLVVTSGARASAGQRRPVHGSVTVGCPRAKGWSVHEATLSMVGPTGCCIAVPRAFACPCRRAKDEARHGFGGAIQNP